MRLRIEELGRVRSVMQRWWVAVWIAGWMTVGTAAEMGSVGVAAVVNGEAVTTLEVQERQRVLAARLAQRGERVREEGLFAEALELLIEERLQLQAARRLGVQVTAEEVERAIEAIAARNRLSVEGLKEAVAREGMEWRRFRREVELQLVLQRLRERVAQGNDTVSEAEVDHFVAAFPELRRRFAEEAAGVMQVRLRHILLKGLRGGRDEELRARLWALRERLTQGESFADLARVHSEDGSAVEGGEVGWVLPGEFVPEAERVVERLKPGEISEPIKSRLGWHLVEVIARRPLTEDPDAFRNFARQKLRERKRQQALEAFLQSLQAEAVIERPKPMPEAL
ncbi:MAG: peptidylprolyl isomerase [Hydrogenophilus sp.]|nr:peptidylprolyl isomerase [Hydrogenophilus sp.]